VILALLIVALSGWKFNKVNRERAPSAGTDVLSIFYCGFGGNYCGQSTDDDVNPGATNVILAFLNTNADGSVSIDGANFPTVPFAGWKAAGKNVLASVGGQNGNWGTVLGSNTTITAFVNSIV